MPEALAANARIRYARIAGFIYLLLIVLFMSGQFAISHVVGEENFADDVQHIVAGERLYRVALSLQMLASVLTVLLAYALYATLRSVNEDLARMAMYWRLGEAFIGGAAAMIDFATLNLYADPKYLELLGADKLQAVIGLARSVGFASFNITTTFFSVGSTLFFYLFLASRCIPRVLSALGVFASIVVLFTSLGNLVLPAHADVIQFGWAPIFVAEIGTGLWLWVRGVKTSPDSGP
ncbi:DUF4386 domain-containing protein [Rhodanobacter sp. T12-5]|uniref:DUF4386 domain-containing protein n=1 Tax=Rhodanobacter sp. T12-5 TaxID=2024611 RepID=UPI0011EF2232|nr:DUF4386 domain-containing protein [Rhodanobacter sp. T12-5]KAA0068612.1 DUF4386 domain-containing protein [Rhodanobacter sp. T12-5]